MDDVLVSRENLKCITSSPKFLGTYAFCLSGVPIHKTRSKPSGILAICSCFAYNRQVVLVSLALLQIISCLFGCF